MRRVLVAAMVGVSAVIFGGCVGLGSMLEKAGKDNASVYGSVDTVYGKGKGCRVNPKPIPGSTVIVVCDQDGMKYQMTTPAR